MSDQRFKASHRYPSPNRFSGYGHVCLLAEMPERMDALTGTTLQAGTDVAGHPLLCFDLVGILPRFVFLVLGHEFASRNEKKLEVISKKLEGGSDGTSGQAKTAK